MVVHSFIHTDSDGNIFVKNKKESLREKVNFYTFFLTSAHLQCEEGTLVRLLVSKDYKTCHPSNSGILNTVWKALCLKHGDPFMCELLRLYVCTRELNAVCEFVKAFVCTGPQCKMDGD